MIGFFIALIIWVVITLLLLFWAGYIVNTDFKGLNQKKRTPRK